MSVHTYRDFKSCYNINIIILITYLIIKQGVFEDDNKNFNNDQVPTYYFSSIITERETFILKSLSDED